MLKRRISGFGTPVWRLMENLRPPNIAAAYTRQSGTAKTQLAQERGGSGEVKGEREKMRRVGEQLSSGLKFRHGRSGGKLLLGGGPLGSYTEAPRR